MKKDNRLFASAVIVAAGRSTRMNMERSKQYVEIAGIPVLARTLQVFQRCDEINEIIVVVNEQDIMYCKQSIVEEYELSKVRMLVSGGSERQNSVYNGLLEVCERCDIVLVHDGARPFVTSDIIANSIYEAQVYGAACVAVPAKDTIKMAGPDNFVKETLDRSLLWVVQTPQAFRYSLIMDAHKKASEDGFTGTDDAVLVERLGVPMKLVMGSYENIKITTRDDLAIGEAIIAARER